MSALRKREAPPQTVRIVADFVLPQEHREFPLKAALPVMFGLPL
jgi:hypothetical protein